MSFLIPYEAGQRRAALNGDGRTVRRSLIARWVDATNLSGAIQLLTSAQRPEPILLDLQPHLPGIATIEAILVGHRVSLMVDTGASHTLLSRATADRLELKCEPGSQPVHTHTGATVNAPVVAGMTLNIGSLSLPDRDIPVIDLGFLNQGLAAEGSPVIDGILGMDVLLECDAIIDLAVGSLRLSHPSPPNSI